MRPDEFQAQCGINDDVMQKFHLYHALLLKWQKAINLVSPKTIHNAWARHFYDSAQIAPYMPNHVKTMADLGSGAGFAGLVLAILRPDLTVHLVESDQRKCAFLKTVSRETNTPCVIHDRRIADVYNKITPDLITARALAPLTDLLAHCEPWGSENKALQFLFLKGENAPQEIDNARTQYNFDSEIIPSKTNKHSKIICIKNVMSLDVQV